MKFWPVKEEFDPDRGKEIRKKYNAADNALAAASLETHKKGTPSPLLIHSLSHLLRKKIFLIHNLSHRLRKTYF